MFHVLSFGLHAIVQHRLSPERVFQQKFGSVTQLDKRGPSDRDPLASKIPTLSERFVIFVLQLLEAPGKLPALLIDFSVDIQWVEVKIGCHAGTEAENISSEIFRQTMRNSMFSITHIPPQDCIIEAYSSRLTRDPG